MIYHQLYGIPVKIVRPFNVYGPGMKENDYRVIPTFMTKLIRGESLPVYDKGNQTRTFCYITDAIQGFMKILVRGRNGEAYNVGSDNGEINMVSLATLLNQLFSKSAPIQLTDYPDSYPAGEPQRRCPDLTKIKKELEFSPTVDLAIGLTRTLAWYQEELNRA